MQVPPPLRKIAIRITTVKDIERLFLRDIQDRYKSFHYTQILGLQCRVCIRYRSFCHTSHQADFFNEMQMTIDYLLINNANLIIRLLMYKSRQCLLTGIVAPHKNSAWIGTAYLIENHTTKEVCNADLFSVCQKSIILIFTLRAAARIK